MLVHGENPVCESMVIIEYIEEMWPQNPLMLNDPYDRALARFWIKFAEDKVRITARANMFISLFFHVCLSLQKMIKISLLLIKVNHFSCGILKSFKTAFTAKKVFTPKMFDYSIGVSLHQERNGKRGKNLEVESELFLNVWKFVYIYIKVEND